MCIRWLLHCGKYRIDAGFAKDQGIAYAADPAEPQISEPYMTSRRHRCADNVATPRS